LSGSGSSSKEERLALIRLEDAKKRAARKWTNHGQHPPPSLIPPAGGWAISSSSRWRARSLSFEVDVKGLEAELELEAEAETESAPAPAQQVLGSEDFIVDSERPSGVPSSSRAFDHRRRPRP
jgi:hypothetical protein